MVPTSRTHACVSSLRLSAALCQAPAAGRLGAGRVKSGQRRLRKLRRIEPLRAVFPVTSLDPSKLTIRYLSPTAADASALSQSSPPRRYTLTHNDLTAQLYLTIGEEFDQRSLQGWYARLIRDEVVAEWRFSSGAGPVLHLHVHVSGSSAWFSPPKYRDFVFQRELPLVLDSIVYAERELLAQQALCDALVVVHFEAAEQYLARVEFWGTLGEWIARDVDQEAAVHLNSVRKVLWGARPAPRGPRQLDGPLEYILEKLTDALLQEPRGSSAVSALRHIALQDGCSRGAQAALPAGGAAPLGAGQDRGPRVPGPAPAPQKAPGSALRAEQAGGARDVQSSSRRRHGAQSELQCTPRANVEPLQRTPDSTARGGRYRASLPVQMSTATQARPAPSTGCSSAVDSGTTRGRAPRCTASSTASQDGAARRSSQRSEDMHVSRAACSRESGYVSSQCRVTGVEGKGLNGADRRDSSLCPEAPAPAAGVAVTGAELGPWAEDREGGSREEHVEVAMKVRAANTWRESRHVGSSWLLRLDMAMLPVPSGALVERGVCVALSVWAVVQVAPVVQGVGVCDDEGRGSRLLQQLGGGWGLDFADVCMQLVGAAMAACSR